MDHKHAVVATASAKAKKAKPAEAKSSRPERESLPQDLKRCWTELKRAADMICSIPMREAVTNASVLGVITPTLREALFNAHYMERLRGPALCRFIGEHFCHQLKVSVYSDQGQVLYGGEAYTGPLLYHAQLTPDQQKRLAEAADSKSTETVCSEEDLARIEAEYARTVRINGCGACTHFIENGVKVKLVPRYVFANWNKGHEDDDAKPPGTRWELPDSFVEAKTWPAMLNIGRRWRVSEVKRHFRVAVPGTGKGDGDTDGEDEEFENLRVGPHPSQCFGDCLAGPDASDSDVESEKLTQVRSTPIPPCVIFRRKEEVSAGASASAGPMSRSTDSDDDCAVERIGGMYQSQVAPSRRERLKENRARHRRVRNARSLSPASR